jgi:hypothetical protein
MDIDVPLPSLPPLPPPQKERAMLRRETSEMAHKDYAVVRTWQTWQTWQTGARGHEHLRRFLLLLRASRAFPDVVSAHAMTKQRSIVLKEEKGKDITHDPTASKRFLGAILRKRRPNNNKRALERSHVNRADAFAFPFYFRPSCHACRLQTISLLLSFSLSRPHVQQD